ncbi:PQQ-binding-like beta-propeller repeat protein [Halosimplex pelagicum]|uniref:PQQ-binding-like beta-propeller repeat protein n=1 Tax=Halosimplex pelagicum TaxID=869886 RepID=A0A7D5P937_9EURY|nr:PQQ-binding-like beta-propeller repeat protein [Halosimplex pelagicum]QLH80482.1 PQQ-binding-like beta-propeller repeat protein [Halosimplex pelagicum]
MRDAATDPDVEADGPADADDSRRSTTGTASGREWSRRRALASLASAGSLALAGCSLPSLGGVDPVWERDFPDAVGAGQPAASADHVVVGGQDRRIHGFTADGERVVDIETGGPVEARPAVPASGGPVHVHSTDGDLYTVDLSGERLWHVEGLDRDGWLGRSGSLVVHSDPVEGTVTGYDARDGARRFRRPGQDYPAPTLGDAVCLLARPDSDGERTYVAVDPATGEVRWALGPDEGYPWAVAGDRVVTVRDATVRLRRARDGSVLWHRAVEGDVGDGFGRPVWVGEDVYVRVEHRDGPDELVALDREAGDVLWRRAVGFELEAVTATAEGVFTASEAEDPDGGILIRLDAFDADGTRRWQTTTDISIGGTVEALGRTGEVVFAASDNEIAAYDPDGGQRRWRHEPDASRIGIAAAGDALYVSYRDRGGVARLPTG